MFGMNDVVCLENIVFTIKDKEQNKVNLKTNCGKWIEKPEDEEILITYQYERLKEIPQKSGRVIPLIIPNDNTPF